MTELRQTKRTDCAAGKIGGTGSCPCCLSRQSEPLKKGFMFWMPRRRLCSAAVWFNRVVLLLVVVVVPWSGSTHGDDHGTPISSRLFFGVPSVNAFSGSHPAVSERTGARATHSMSRGSVTNLLVTSSNPDDDDDSNNIPTSTAASSSSSQCSFTRKDKARRNFVLATTATLWTTTTMGAPSQSSAATETATSKKSSSPSPSPSSSSSPTYIKPEQAVVTHKVFFDVRISRSDGTFYVRDDADDDPVFSGRLVLGLFGNNAPNHVARFLQYVTVKASDNEEEAPYPSYGRSSFPKFDDATGLLYGGSIPSLQLTELGGTTALKYGGRLLPAKLWMDSSTVTVPKIRHSSVGLLTHAALDPTPVFGITTRADTTQLDRTHTVFGQLAVSDNASSSSNAFLKRVAALPSYSVDRPVAASFTTDNVMLGNGNDNTFSTTTYTNNPAAVVLDEAAGAIFAAQREFFRGAAKSLGDSRVEKVYQGKLLRRVEVTQVGMLPL